MDTLVTIINALPDDARFFLMDTLPFLFAFLDLFYTVFEDGSII